MTRLTDEREGLPTITGKWTIETLKEYTTRMIDNLIIAQTVQMASLKELLNERFAAQTKAGEVAFVAQQTALTTGLLTAERGVETALAAAKEATTKAEVNATARFEQFRSESGLQIKTLSDKLDSEIGRVSERLGELAARLDSTIGRGTGAAESRSESRLNNGQVMALAGFLVALTAVIAGLFFK